MRSSSRNHGQPASNKRWLIRQVSLFKDLTEEQLAFVDEHSRLVEFEKDEFIYRQGEPADCLYGIASGRVRILLRHGTDPSETAEILHRGDYFGTASILTNEPHSVTTQAGNDSILLKIKKADFETLLKKIPQMAIHLSTTLSRRLRQRETQAKRIFESTLISLYSPFPGSGRTMYAVNLAASIHKETGKKVLLIDMSAAGTEVCRALGVAAPPAPLQLKSAAPDHSKVTSLILKHPSCGFDTLGVVHGPNVSADVAQITPLLSYLANFYHFVITDLPHSMDRMVFKALVQADSIHLVCNGSRAQLESTVGVLDELRKTIQQAANRVKVVINELSSETGEAEQGEILRHRIYATLPKVEIPTAPGHPVVLAHPDWEYARAIRRISREIGGVLVGLVLGSGAAMGLSHIGVLRVLERENIPIDIVAGSSIGALIAALWASGRNSDELEKIADLFKSKWSLLKLVDPPFPGPKFGILRGQEVTRLLTRQLGDKTFRDLCMPVKVIAVDYARREVKVLDEGSVVRAVRASVAIPGIFEPIRIRGRWLIDGGVLDPVPVDVLAQMGVHKIIAVNTLPSPADINRRHQELAEERVRLEHEARQRGWLRYRLFRIRQAGWRWMDSNIFDVIMHTMQGMEYVLAEAQCAQADVALHPTVPRVNWWEFYNVEQLIRRGEEETMAHLPEIKKLISE